MSAILWNQCEGSFTFADCMNTHSKGNNTGSQAVRIKSTQYDERPPRSHLRDVSYVVP
jgi:hypothetical protein